MRTDRHQDNDGYEVLEICRDEDEAFQARIPHVVIPPVRRSSLMEEIKFLLEILVDLEEKASEKTRKEARKLFFKKVGYTAAHVTATAFSVAGTGIGWTLFGVRGEEARRKRLALGDTYWQQISTATTHWAHNHIPDSNESCAHRYPHMFCDKAQETFEPFCQELKQQFCTAVQQYHDWQRSPRIDGLQCIILIFGVITSVATIILLITLVLTFLSYCGKAKSTTENQVDVDLKEEALLNSLALHRERALLLLDKLEELTGERAPIEDHAALVNYLKHNARIILQEEEKCRFLFYMLENQRRSHPPIVSFYRGSNPPAPQMIINHLAESTLKENALGESTLSAPQNRP